MAGIRLKLEAKKFSTGLGGIPPNLDVLLTCSDGTPFAIESKFAEPYTKSRLKTYLKEKYFHDGRSLWMEVALPGCQAIADSLRTGQHEFKVLDVAQLLKHMLALGHSGQHWSLCCLWFEVPGWAADQHRQELTDFASRIGADAVHFSTFTYQELFARMVPFAGQNDREYIAYLRDRYMSDAVVS